MFKCYRRKAVTYFWKAQKQLEQKGSYTIYMHTQFTITRILIIASKTWPQFSVLGAWLDKCNPLLFSHKQLWKYLSNVHPAYLSEILLLTLSGNSMKSSTSKHTEWLSNLEGNCRVYSGAFFKEMLHHWCCWWYRV